MMRRQRASLATLLCPLFASLAGWASASPAALPLTIARPAFGGEALFRGYLGIENGCVVAVSPGRSNTVLFDPDVRRLEDGQGIFDPSTNQSIRFGEAVTGGAAFLRDDGRGWPISDIESFFGVALYRGCPKDNVQRLHNLNQVRGRDD